MKEYYLFLDETKPNGKTRHHYGVAGYAIEAEHYKNFLVPEITRIKHTYFPDPQLPFHLYDIKKNKKGFEFLSDHVIRDKLFEEIKKVIKMADMNIFCAAVDVNKYNNMYLECAINNEYNVAFQMVIENFVYFLIEKDGIGNLYLESQDHEENKKIRLCYYNLLSKGTLLLNSDIMLDRLLSIYFPLKADNNIGVQLADLIPITLVDSVYKSGGGYYGLYNIFKDKIYKQHNDMATRYSFINLF